MNRRELLALGSATLAGARAPRLAAAQGNYPERPIKLMVAFSAGGVNDVVARQWAERVKTLLGTVYVENQGGGSGTIATGEVARAQPDGYTILLGSTSTMVLNPMTMAKVPYDPARDFVPIAIIAVSTTSIVVHESVPVRTLKELIAYAKANPGKLSYGSAGAGTMSNLSGELFKQLTGLNDLVHIPYKGAGPGITDLVSGHIPMMTPNVTAQVLELNRAGKIRILAASERGARHSDRDRARRPGHDRAPLPRPVRAGRHAQAHPRSHRRSHARGDDGRRIPEGVDRIRPRSDPRLQFRESQALHR
jgi:tripartite-type tricarboxylate transporter receptor subunit TctC